MPILCPKQYRHNWAGLYLLEKAQTGANDERPKGMRGGEAPEEACVQGSLLIPKMEFFYKAHI